MISTLSVMPDLRITFATVRRTFDLSELENMLRLRDWMTRSMSLFQKFVNIVNVEDREYLPTGQVQFRFKAPKGLNCCLGVYTFDTVGDVLDHHASHFMLNTCRGDVCKECLDLLIQPEAPTQIVNIELCFKPQHNTHISATFRQLSHSTSHIHGARLEPTSTQIGRAHV